MVNTPSGKEQGRMSLYPASFSKLIAAGLVWLVLIATSPAGAQLLPWITYEDPESASVCSVVNADVNELVVLDETGQLAIVTGEDLVLVDSFVDFDGFVVFEGSPAGFLGFATDGDGFRTLWWLADTGEVIRLNAFFRPTLSDFLPGDFSGVLCDACPLWDDPSACDADLDGVLDIDDLCPGTPSVEPIDVFGCSCSQADEDGDGVNDCLDLCPNSFVDSSTTIDLDGCVVPTSGGSGTGTDTTIVFCGAMGIPALAMMFTGLTLTGMLRGPSVRRGQLRRATKS